MIVEAGPPPTGGKIAATDPSDSRWRFQTTDRGVSWLRAHAVGGRAHIWGGNSHRFSKHVFKNQWWPYSAGTLLPYYDSVENWLHVRSNPLASRYVNLGKRLGVRVEATRCSVDSGGLWTGVDVPAGGKAVRGFVTRLEIDAARASGLAGLTARGQPFHAAPRAIVLAASPIETARLLLASGVKHPLIGKQLTDHFSTFYILAQPSRASGDTGPLSAFIPRFVNTSRHTQRSYQGGFCIELRGNVERSRFSEEFIGLISDRVDPETASFTTIAAMGEQFPHPDRFVDLAPRALDSIGRPLPRVHRASLVSGERHMLSDMRACCLAIADELAGPGAVVLRTADPGVEVPIFHPAGTCVIGNDDATPCDIWGRCRQLRNVWIADASALPTAGDCAPTLTVLAHAARVCESVRHALK